MKIGLSILAIAACALSPAIPLAAGTNKSPAKIASVQSAWAPETLSGKIVIVDPAKKLVVVKTPQGIPFDMEVTANTRINMGNRHVSIKDLSQDVDKQVSVKFVPERRGDVARSIQVGG